jgi:Kef-type K+ transport system membrane component KefB
MSSLWLLMGLLVLSYAGSFLVGKSAVRGGLPAGTEYVLLGFVLGPGALGLVERSMLVNAEPLAHAAVGWLAFVLGLQYGVNRGRRVRTARIVASWLAFLVTGATIAAAVWGVLRLASHLDARDRLLVAGGIGAATGETTRYAVRWVVERDRAAGPLSDLLGDLAESDDMVPLFGVAALFALRPEAALSLAHQPPWIWIAVTLGLGAVLGGMAAVLLGRTFRVAEAWSVLLGMSMLAIGTASRLGLASVAAMFVMGTAISALSPHRSDIVAMIAPTERPVMLPALLLAGASVDFTGPAMAGARWLPWVLGAAVLARLAAKQVVGLGLLAAVPSARSSGARLGLGLSSAGALSMSIGLVFALRFPGPVGGAVLASALLATVVGEIVGPASLRACLRRADEVPDDKPAPPPDRLPDSAAEAPAS